jgi:hypothetical protein
METFETLAVADHRGCGILPSRPARRPPTSTVVLVTAGTPAQGAGHPMAQPTQQEDITSWLQLLSAIEEAEAGRGTARLAEICLSAYGALAAAQFQITQLRARVYALAASGLARTAVP